MSSERLPATLGDSPADRKGNDVDVFNDWIYWVFPLGIALTTLWDGRRQPATLHMAVFWTVAEIYGAFLFQAGFRWCAIVGVAAVTVACLPGLRRLLTAPVPYLPQSLERIG